MSVTIADGVVHHCKKFEAQVERKEGLAGYTPPAMERFVDKLCSSQMLSYVEVRSLYYTYVGGVLVNTEGIMVFDVRVPLGGSWRTLLFNNTRVVVR